MPPDRLHPDPIAPFQIADAVLGAQPNGIVAQAADGQIIYANDQAATILGLPLDQLTGRTSIDPRWRAVHRDGRPYPGETHPAMRTLATGLPVDDAIMGVHHPDGKLVWLSVSTRVIALPDGSRGCTSSFVDITRRFEQYAMMLAANERFEVLFQTTPNGSAIIDLDQTPGRMLQVNWALGELTAMAEQDLLASWLMDLFEPHDQVKIRSALDQLLDGSSDRVHVEAKLNRSDEIRWADVTLASVIDSTGRLSYAVVQFNDITQRRGREHELLWQSTHDQLTGLANRKALGDRLEQMIRDEPRRQRVAVLFCDLDGFKQVNDDYGHAAGDTVLMTVADRLQAAVRSNDLVARHGGDEFIILLDRVGDDTQLEAIGQRIVDTIRAPITIGDQEVNIGVSIGAVRPRSNDSHDVLRRADAAMYLAKTAGKDQLLLVQ